MGCATDPFTRWLHKRLTHRFRNADLLRPYPMAFSSIKKESQFFLDDRISRHIKRIDKAIEELSKANILLRVEQDIKRGTGRGKPIIDAVWKIYPHPSQVSERKLPTHVPAKLMPCRFTMKFNWFH